MDTYLKGLGSLTELERSIGRIVRSSELTAFQGTVEGIMSSSALPTFQGAFDGIMRFSELTSLQTAVQGIAHSSELLAIQQAVTGIMRSLEMTSLLSQKLLEPLAPFREAARLEEAGWFPHNTFPGHLLSSTDGDSSADEVVLNYYQDNWATVKQEIEQELSACNVDSDAKEMLREALIAHEHKLHRLVPTSLFPAIERAVRDCLCGNKLGNIEVNEQLEDSIAHMPLSMLPGGALGFVGFTLLSHHLYENVYTDAARNRFEDASVPNRHAAIHGLVTYSSEKSSLNAIFIAIYVFRVLTVLISGVPQKP